VDEDEIEYVTLGSPDKYVPIAQKMRTRVTVVSLGV
jgi:hypothetical protein